MGAAGFSDLYYRGPNLIQDIFHFIRPKLFNSSFLNREQSHQVLPHLPKHLRVVSATDTSVVLQNALCQAGSTQFNIANDGES